MPVTTVSQTSTQTANRTPPPLDSHEIGNYNYKNNGCIHHQRINRAKVVTAAPVVMIPRQSPTSAEAAVPYRTTNRKDDAKMIAS
mmetsp:Transcript_23742/g.42466  ORF Transcript_23742/g.42466 Transcript_23742/m.42466 type:complete len:85 (+) Transcript_23742:189-443(+)